MRAWLALALLLPGVGSAAFGGPGDPGGTAFGDPDLLRESASKEERRFLYIGEQGFDTSCGYAAAAGLASLYWQVPVSETELIALNHGTIDASGSQTVNLADIARSLQALGFEVQGGRADWEGLRIAAERYAPVLVHYARPETHFALVLAADRDAVVSADPARGLELVGRAQFEKRWSGVVLLVKADQRRRNDRLLGAAIAGTRGRRSLLERIAEGRPSWR